MFVLFMMFANSNSIAADVVGDDSNLTTEEVEQLYKQMTFLYNGAQSKELTLRNISSYYLGNPIYSYECIDGDLVELNYLTYPIYNDNDIVSLALKIEQEDGTFIMQITDCFVGEFIECDLLNEKIVLIYDKYNAYVMTENDVSVISTYSYPIDYRDVFNNDEVYNSIILNEVTKVKTIDFTNNQVQPCSSNAYSASLPVSYVTQLPDDQICWAASTACIGNYLTGNSKTAVEIAQSVFGTDYNKAASIATAQGALRNNYSVDYQFYQDWTAPTDELLYANLYSGYPVFGRFEKLSDTNIHHLTVISGILEDSHVIIMDPMFGFTLAYKSDGKYTYVSNYSGSTFELMGYGSKG